MRNRLILLLMTMLTCVVPAQKTAPADSASHAAVFARVKEATVVILAGEGAGRLHSLATGVFISKDGILLTANHAVKGAAEVQVRLSNGETFDHVELLGVDERRDIAALKITAGNQPFLAPATATPAVGDPVYAVTNSSGLTFSATEGILSATRPSGEIAGAGTGYRVLQFTAPVTHGASGGALVNGQGELLGIIVSGLGAGEAFAVPIDSVLNLADSSHPVRLGSGADLRMPAQRAETEPVSSAALAQVKSDELLKRAHTLFIDSKTVFLPVATLTSALLRQKQWNELGLVLVEDPHVADLHLEIDRVVFTHIHTFVLADTKTSVVLGSGRQTALDGNLASGGLATDIVAILAAARLPTTAKP